MQWISSLPPFFPPIRLSHHCLDGWSPGTGYAELSSGGMPFVETHATVVDSLRVTLLSSARASSHMDHSSATNFLPNSLTINPSSSSHSSSQFAPLPISFLTAFETHCFPSCSNDPSSFPFYMPSNFPANALFLSIDFFSFPSSLSGPISFHSFLEEYSNHFPSKCWALSFLVAQTLTRRIGFPSCWLTETSEILQRATAKAADVRSWWLLLFAASLIEQFPRRTSALPKIFFLVNIRISPLHFLLLVLRLVVHVR